MIGKTSMPVDKKQWHPSMLPGQIVAVSTYADDGSPNFAPKSWLTMVSFEGPTLAFGCNLDHSTYQHIMQRGCFVVNIPDASQTEALWASIQYRGAERVARSPFRLEAASVVDAPLLVDFRGHLECRFAGIKAFGREVLIFGTIAAVLIDTACCDQEDGLAHQYFKLRPAFFLEDGAFGSLDTAYTVDQRPPTDQRFFVVEVEHACVSDEAHLSFINSLRTQRILLMSGCFEGPSAEPSRSLATMYIISARDLAEAHDVVRADPLVVEGAPVRIRPWRRSF